MQVKVLLDPTSEADAGGVAPDLIASVTFRVPLTGLLKVTQETQGRQGDVVLVRVKTVNQEYSLLETRDGEEVPLHEGDLVLGALGTRKALQGFSGGPPSEMEPGMELYLLNRGGALLENVRPFIGTWVGPLWWSTWERFPIMAGRPTWRILHCPWSMNPTPRSLWFWWWVPA